MKIHVDSVTTYQISVVRPTSKLHETSLFVEGKIFHIDFAKGFIDSRRFPSHFARVMENRFGHDCYFVVSISTKRKKKNLRFAKIKLYGTANLLVEKFIGECFINISRNKSSREEENFKYRTFKSNKICRNPAYS